MSKSRSSLLLSSVSRTVASVYRLIKVCVCFAVLSACEDPEPVISGGEPSLRRLTEEQYRNVISDLFGDHIVIAGRFDPILRQDGLIAIGAGNATISASSFDKHEKLARAISDQIVSNDNRSLYIPCEPAELDRSDTSCARAFLEPVGRFLFRRPLSEQELDDALTLASVASDRLGNFYDGLAFGLTSLLVNPNFLFIVDHVESSGDAENQVQLTGYAKASRLSFFLWNTAPDGVLLDAAASGQLDSDSGLKAQIDRMLQSPKVRDGVAALFTDMFHLEEFDHLEKDNLIYPAFDPEAIEDARTQLILTIQHHLLDKDADYRTLFSTNTSFISGSLGRIYRTPVTEPALWTPYEFSDTEGRAGIHMLAGFIALHSHPGRSSPTIRGKAVRELIMCQKVPDPPGDVDFSLFNEPRVQTLTARDRLDIHNSVPSCAGCHRLTDTIGLSMEKFDGAGQFRVNDQGQTIDASGSLDGIDFEDHAGLSAALSTNSAVPACFVQKTLSYGLGRELGKEERVWFDYVLQKFEQNGYRFKPLMRSIATSDNFFAVQAPTPPSAMDARAGAVNTAEKRS
jgi:hypothetical protein